MSGATDTIQLDLPDQTTPSGMHRTLTAVAALWSFLWLNGFYHLVLSPEHRASVAEAARPLRSTGGELVSFAAVAVVLAFFGIHVLKVHQSVYDRHLVKWRQRHDADFILRRLFAPYAHALVQHFDEILKRKSLEILRKVFCPFVTHGRSLIDARLIQRFYRALTVYWISQLNEMALLLWFLSAALYALLGRWTGAISEQHQAFLVVPLVTSLFAAAANAFGFVRFARRTVRARAADEIDEIIQERSAELEQYVLSAAKRYDMLIKDSKRLLGPAVIAGNGADTGESNHVFVASPMSSISPAEYTDERQLMLRIVGALANQHQVKVHYGGQDVESAERVDDPYVALTIGMRMIRASHGFVFHWPNRAASSALFELGFAVALGRQVLILVRDRNQLPYLLRAASQLPNVRECTYRDQEQLMTMLEQHIPELLGVRPNGVGVS